MEGALVYWCHLITFKHAIILVILYQSGAHFISEFRKLVYAAIVFPKSLKILCIWNDKFFFKFYVYIFSPTGKAVSGSYQVALPDGRVQTVTYTADHYNGYVADVKYEGVPVYPEAKPYHPAPAPKYHPAPKYAPAHA